MYRERQRDERLPVQLFFQTDAVHPKECGLIVSDFQQQRLPFKTSRYQTIRLQ